ncbi:MAG: type II toxin-antitoxin system VapC family toxin [Verrucomicrobia bacterium]|nr:type II toxin-antitoxin system VapC family toxin [Verrucomicrobiota bacterium]
MSFLLDTNVVSEATRPQPSAVVLDWIAAQIGESLFISAITLGELQRGALLLAVGKRRKELLRWIETGIKTGFAGRILPVDALVMERWAHLEATTAKSGRRLPLMDSLLAATALAHDLTLATRNLADFKASGVPLVDPWAGR